MKFASTFLIHSPADDQLTETIAVALGRRGIVSWLDNYELDISDSLTGALKEAIKRQALIVVFVAQNNEVWNAGIIEALAAHQDWSSSVMVINSDESREHPSELTEKIARRILLTISQQVVETHQLLVCFDERGTGGLRTGSPINVPRELGDIDTPMLVFRHDRGERDILTTLREEEWREYWKTVKTTLGRVLPQRDAIPVELHLFGSAQLALPLFLGKYLSRESNINLHGYNIPREERISEDGGGPRLRNQKLRPTEHFTNARYSHLCAPTGGNQHCETAHPEIDPIGEGEEIETVALLLMRKEYATQALRFVNTPGHGRPVLVEHDMFVYQGEVDEYVSNVIALLQRLTANHSLRRIEIFTSLPFHVLPLLGASLHNVVNDVIFIESGSVEASIDPDYVALSYR